MFDLIKAAKNQDENGCFIQPTTGCYDPESDEAELLFKIVSFLHLLRPPRRELPKRNQFTFAPENCLATLSQE